VSPATSRSLRRSLAPLALMALIFALSAQTDLNSGLGAVDLIGRKVIHASTFALLTWLWFWALRGTAGRPMAGAVAISVLYAISDEYHQQFVHGRHGSPIDVLIDCVGIVAVVWWNSNRRRARGAAGKDAGRTAKRA
jgi:VanZ family protein